MRLCSLRLPRRRHLDTIDHRNPIQSSTIAERLPCESSAMIPRPLKSVSPKSAVKETKAFHETWLRQRRLRLFADRCSAHIADASIQRAVRSEILRMGGQVSNAGVDLDPRFPVRVDARDLEDGRVAYILHALNGLRYFDDLRIHDGLERSLVASNQQHGRRFAWRTFPAKAPVSIRLIDSNIGLGLFAERDLAVGELIGEYAGYLTLSEAIADSMYSYSYPPLGIGQGEVRLSIDARTMGNETRFINHATEEVVNHDYDYYNGLWHVMFTVSSPVSKDQQLLIDYGEGYWEARAKGPELLAP